MGRLSTAICFMLALLTVLSIIPVFLLFCACELSPSCLMRGFGHFLIGPAGLRKPAVVVLLGPVFILIAYVMALRNCHRRDILNRSGHRYG